MDEAHFIFLMTFIVMIGVSITVTAVLFDNSDVEELYLTHTCDEISIIENDLAYRSDKLYYEKCMKDIFPDGYPDEMELREYFTTLECRELGTHIIKLHFEFDVAENIYNVKCNTPLERMELGEIKFERTETKHKDIPQQEYGYGKQYREWGN